jgi:hypothetical protein
VTIAAAMAANPDKSIPKMFIHEDSTADVATLGGRFLFLQMAG